MMTGKWLADESLSVFEVNGSRGPTPETSAYFSSEI